MKKISSFIFIFVFLVLLGGCYCGPCCPTCPPTQTGSCNLIVTVTYTSNVYGTLYLNDKSTGLYVDFEYCPSAQIKKVPCGLAKVYFIDSGPCVSHVEYIDLKPGDNYITFTYW